METQTYIAFVLVSFGIIVIPGPNVLFIVSTSLDQGRTRALQAVAGTSLAMALQLLIAALTTVGFVRIMAEGFVWLKLLGVVYLVYLGLRQCARVFFAHREPAPTPAAASFAGGFLVALSNPKTLLFFAAFLPQFVSNAAAYAPQILLLSLSFLVMAIVLDGTYAVLAARLRPWLQRAAATRVRAGLGAMLYLGAALWLAATRRLSA